MPNISKLAGIVAVAVPLLSPAALCQSISVTKTVPNEQAPPVVPAKPPFAANNHECSNQYPPAALAAGEEGTVTLAFRIGSDGSPKNISVFSKSPYPDLDQAAVTCAAQWKYNPVMQNGQPVEVDWKATVNWSMADTRPAESVVVTLGPPPDPAKLAAIQAMAHKRVGDQTCKNPSNPPAPLGKMTVVMFHVQVDGSVRWPSIYRSSGDDTLDEYALECAKTWRYTPWTGAIRADQNVMVVPVPW